MIPFFRYPDVSGLGPESQFAPPLLPDTPAGASLLEDQVQSQDAYGSDTTVTIGGVTVPLPDLAVGRLVKTPAEIQGTDRELPGAARATLPRPRHQPGDRLRLPRRRGRRRATRVPRRAARDRCRERHSHHPPERGRRPSRRGTRRSSATRCSGSHHDLVYLAGHFSANDTLAADFATTFDADDLGPRRRTPTSSRTRLVLSAGCHSGYNIVDSAGVPTAVPGTNTVDWTQRMAQQKAVLIGGTGYQYGDTDFLEYSERLYLDIARRLHEDDRLDRRPIAIGNALVLAKQDYLSEPHHADRHRPEGDAAGHALRPADDGLRRAAAQRAADADQHASARRRRSRPGPPAPASASRRPTCRWSRRTARDTKTGRPGRPDLQPQVAQRRRRRHRSSRVRPRIPKQVKDVTVADKVLRGVGFWSGDYTDTNGVLPLTGAPAIEGVDAQQHLPVRRVLPAAAGHGELLRRPGRQRPDPLVLTPAQYRTFGDPEAAVPTNTVRNYAQPGHEAVLQPEDLHTCRSASPTRGWPPRRASARSRAPSAQRRRDVLGPGDR